MTKILVLKKSLTIQILIKALFKEIQYFSECKSLFEIT